MALSYKQLMSWKPSSVEAAAEDVSNKIRKKYLNQQDEIDAGRVPGSWHGEAAGRAQLRFTKLRDGLNDLNANTSPIVEAAQTAAGEIRSAQRSAQHAFEAINSKQLNGKKWHVPDSASTDSVSVTQPALSIGDGDDADGTQDDVDRINGEVDGLANDLKAALVKGEQADNDLSVTLNSCGKEQYDGGSGTISSAGLPPELRGLPEKDIANRVLNDPGRYGGYMDDFPPSVRHEIGSQLGHDLDGLDTIKSVGDREQAQKWADFLNKYGTNKDISQGFLGALGPDGARDLLDKMTSWNGSTSYPGLDYAQYANPPIDIGKEHSALMKLENSVAGGLAGSLGAATRNGWVSSSDWAKDLGQDWRSSAILLKAADDNKVAFGGEFTSKLGDKLMDIEGNDPLKWSQLGDASFGGHSLDGDDGDALRQLAKVADNSHESAQALMMDHNLASYMMHDRLTAGRISDDMDDVLRTATVDSATDSGASGKNAADIASWAVHYAAKHDDLDDHYDEELGGIVGTYIGDVYETSVDDAHPVDPPILANHADFDRSELTSVLKHIGGNDTATSIVATSAGKLNQILLDRGAQATLDGFSNPGSHYTVGNDDRFMSAAHNAAGFRGFLEDNLGDGAVTDAEHEAEERKRTAELFTLPMDLIPADKAGPLGSYVVGDIKDQIINHYVGDPAGSAAAEGDDSYDDGRRATELQGLYTLARAEGHAPDVHDLPPQVTQDRDGTVRFNTTIAHDWPRDDNGNLKPPGALTEKEMDRMLRRSEDEEGIGSDVKKAVTTGFDDYQNPHRQENHG